MAPSTTTDTATTTERIPPPMTMVEYGTERGTWNQEPVLHPATACRCRCTSLGRRRRAASTLDFRGLPVVLGSVEFFARIGQHDVGTLGQVQVRRAALRATAGQ